MKSFGIGTALMALALMSGTIYGQDKPRVTPQHPADSGLAALSDAQGFINDMTIANLAEVQLGKMASEKGSNPDVKSFGQMMVKDHTQANDELKQVASRLKVQPPAQVDQKHKDLSDKLSKLSGAEFDREYINAMVMGHEEVLGKLRARVDAGVSGAHTGGAADHPSEGRTHDEGQPNVSRNSNKPVAQDPGVAKSETGKGATTGPGHGDEAVTQWAAKVMPAVQKHLDRAREIQKKVAG